MDYRQLIFKSENFQSNCFKKSRPTSPGKLVNKKEKNQKDWDFWLQVDLIPLINLSTKSPAPPSYATFTQLWVKKNQN